MSQLGEYVHGRSGDKEDRVTIGIRPHNPEQYDWLKRTVTADRVKQHLGSLVKGRVSRIELPALPGLVFLCEEALPGGGASVLRVDAQGKTYFQALARMEVYPPEVDP